MKSYYESIKEKIQNKEKITKSEYRTVKYHEKQINEMKPFEDWEKVYLCQNG